MATIEKPCEIEAGYNLERDTQSVIGHLLYLKIGTKELSADQTVKVPGTFTDETVVGVLESLNWDGGYAQPIAINARVSTKNKQELTLLLHKNLSNTEVLFRVKIYEYDPLAKKYFTSFHSQDTNLKGLIQKDGTQLSLSVLDTPADEVISPQNYALEVGIMPAEIEQTIHFATGDQKNVVKAWGVTFAA